MKRHHLLCAGFGFFALVSSLRAAEIEKIAYPTADDASFVLSVPSNWTMKPAEEEGDFFHLTTKGGAVFSFRTIKGETDALDEAIQASLKQVSEDYSDVKLGDAQDWKPGGQTGFYATGTAKEKDGGAPVTIGMGWCALEDGKIVELWFVADVDDEKDIAAAEKIANSLETP